MNSLGNLAIGYLRTSTSEQHLGLAAQADAVRAWAAREGVTVPRIRFDQGVSGDAPIDRRPGLLDALEDVQEHRASMLLVANRSRVARDVYEAIVIERELQKRRAVVVSCDGSGNGETPDDEMTRRIVDVVNQRYLSAVRVGTRAALAALQKRGKRTGSTPFGWTVVSETDTTLVPEPREMRTVEVVLRLRAEGKTMQAIAFSLDRAKMRSRNGQPLSLTQIGRIIRRGGKLQTEDRQGRHV